MLQPRVEGLTEGVWIGDNLDVSLERELDTTPELALGQYERVQLRTGQFVVLGQVRGSKNTATEELKNSIESVGLLNSIDCANLGADTLTDYINFVNEVWGTHTDISEFEQQRQADGSYYLVIAGHTRLSGVIELQEENRLSVHRTVEAKVHKVTSPWQIIELQLAENIHTQPARERRAVAIVETYEWGLREGKWSTQKEFLEAHNNIGKTVLSEALAFSNIPPRIRSFVQKEAISYNAGIEIGKAAGDLLDYLYYKTGVTALSATEQQLAEILELQDIQLTIEVDKIVDGKLNSTAAEKRIRAWRDRMTREMIDNQAEKEAADEQAMFALDMMTPDEVLAQEMKSAKAELRLILAKYGRMPSTAAQELINLHRAILPDAIINAFIADNERAAERAKRMLGDAVVGQTTLIA